MYVNADDTMGKTSKEIMNGDSGGWWEEVAMAYFTSLSRDSFQDTDINHDKLQAWYSIP
jgi:hypothetical protein